MAEDEKDPPGVTATRRQINAFENLTEAYESLKAAKAKGKASNLELLQLEKDFAEARLAQAKAAGVQGDALEDLRENLKGVVKDLDQATKAQEKFRQEIAEGERITKNYGDALFGISGTFSKLYTDYIPKTAGEFGGLTKDMAKAVLTGQAFKDAAVAMIGASVNLAFAQDEASSAFRQATGAGNEFNTTLYDIERAGAAAGVTMEDAGQATLSLFNTYRDFTNLSESEQTNIGTTVALMNELGVSSGTSAKIMDQATKSLRMSSGQAEETLRTLAATATEIGKPMSEVAEDFAAAAPKLAFHGQAMMGIFQRLEQQSKQTGMSVDELLGIVGDPFDTFEGAGQKVGRLNAILGGPYLNSIDMLNATEEERLDLMKQSIDAAGVSIDMMSKQEQQALANAAGMSVDQLRRSMGLLTAAEEKEAIAQEQLAALAAESKSVMEELRNAMRSLIVENRDLFESFASMITSLSQWIKDLDKGTVKAVFFTTILIGVTAKMFAAVKAVKQFVFWFKALEGATVAAKALTMLGKAFPFVAKGIRLMTLAWNTSPLIAITAIGAIIALFAFHINNLAKAGYSMGDMFKDVGLKILAWTGPLGMAINMFISFYKHIKSGKGVVDALVESLKDLANNMSFGLAGTLLGFGTNIERRKARKTNDVIVTNDGEVIEPNPQDTIMAGKPGGPIAKAFQGIGGFAAGGPMGMILQGALRQTMGPLLKEAITDPVVAALTGTQGGDQKQPINIVVKIGEKELNDQIITALNSPQGSRAISPFYQG